jgi:hypothetical protein
LKKAVRLVIDVRTQPTRFAKKENEMNNLRPHTRGSAFGLPAMLLLASTFISPLRSAVTSNQPWTTIGSDGAEHSGTFTYSGSSAFQSSASGVIRYNVVAVDGLLDTDGPLVSPGRPFLRARFRDPSAASRVTVNLRRTRISDGFTANVPGLILDSNNFAASSSFQDRRVHPCDAVPAFDFVNYVYYVEVIMTRAAGDISPAISAIQLGYDDSPCFVLPTN